MSLRELELDPENLALRFGRQDVLSRAEAGYLLDQVYMCIILKKSNKYCNFDP